MSDELRLPDDLAAMEARLAAHAPPASGLNRDELLYRAGWAACEASVQRQAMLAAPAPNRGRAIAWSFASAALAASVAVAMTLLFQSSAPSQLADLKIATAPATLAAPSSTGSPVVNQQDVAAVAAYLAVIDDAGRRPSSEPLFAVSMLKRKASRPSSPADSAVVVDDPSPSPKTARELQQELLPSGDRSSSPAAQPALGWPWNSHLWGETI